MEDVTVLVNSCDLYESLWDPFFRLFQIQWPDCKYPIVLNTETKIYNCTFLDVKTIAGGENIPWSKRLKNVLKQIDTEYILYLLDDFFLMSPVNISSFNSALELLKSDPLIGYIGLKKNTHYNFIDSNSSCVAQPFFSKDEVKTVNRVNSMSALWRKEWLVSLIKEHETPWEFEIYASIRSRRTPYKVLQINNYVLPPVFDYEVDLEYGYGVTRRKWLPNNQNLFKKYNIEVNYDELGIMDNKPPPPKKSISSTASSSSLKEKLYNVKRYFRKLKKWTKKTIRKIRSLT